MFLALAAVVASATGGLATWQLASSGLPPPQDRVALARPPTTSASARGPGDGRTGAEDRASRRSARSPLPAGKGKPTTATSTPPKTAGIPSPAASTTTSRQTSRPTTTSPRPAPTTRSAPITSDGDRYVPIGPSFSGEASFYGGGDGSDGGPTASGETFDANAFTAASPTLPFNTLLNVCYQGRCVVVRINDRGPYVGGRILDLSAAAARAIGMEEVGVAHVTATPVRRVT